MRKTKRFFTKEEIRKVIKLWEDKTIEELAFELNRPKSSIGYLARKIRICGYKLPRKIKVGSLNFMIKDVIKEFKV